MRPGILRKTVASFPVASQTRPDVGGDGGEIRYFKGNGTTRLLVPGLQEVYGVRIGSTDLPPFITLELPLPGEGGKTELVDNQMYDLFRAETGEDVLVRSMFSNDGIWQDGQEIAIRGIWDDNPTPITPEITQPHELVPH